DAGSGESALGQVGQELLVLPLAPPDDWREDLEPGSFGKLHDLVNDLVRRLPSHRPAALGAVRLPDPRVQDPQVVVDLGDGADGASWVPRGGLLVDGDGR